MRLRSVRQRLRNANGWQRIWCVFAVASALALSVALLISVDETDAYGHERFLGSLLCRSGDSYTQCNIGWIVLWGVAMAGLYLSGMVIAWVAEGFRKR